MFTRNQQADWNDAHLAAYHWYIEMPENETPHHEEANRRSVEPEFAALPIRQPLKAPVGHPPSGRGAKSKAKSGARVGRTPRPETATKSGKRQASVDISEPSKHGKQTLKNVFQHVYLEITPNQSEARSSGPQPSQTTRSYADGNEWNIQSVVVTRPKLGHSFQELLLQSSVMQFLQASSLVSKFESFAHKVRNLNFFSHQPRINLTLIHSFSCLKYSLIFVPFCRLLEGA
jgi:hypothetical protein